ncbi:hypothetical protein [Bacteroides zoogleoformans]|uniref:hypothetical protein n=1 Tax=Bacteroides zoogleoformans TaxID=28119 RepID=UPI00248F056C|nr:hypothetical protein [Bacteroides zoogleoformans]
MRKDNETVRNSNILLTAGGIIFILLGLSGVYFFVMQGIKPAWLQWSVFTLCSCYIETKMFVFIPNNQGDELAVAFYCLGWLLLIYRSKRSLLNKQALAVSVFMFGYLLLHGLAVVYFIGACLILTPPVLVFGDTFGKRCIREWLKLK